jgi:tetratricopeptide (TPR) repeat protein
MNANANANAYAILKVAPNAPQEEIKAAYLRLAKQIHPDRYTGELRETAEAQFRLIEEAYNSLVAGAPPPASTTAHSPGSASAPRPAEPIQLDTMASRPVPDATADDWFRKAKLCCDAHNHHEATAHLQRAINLDPNRAEVHALLGQALERTKGDRRAQVKALEAAIRLDPKDVESHILLANTLQVLGMQSRASRLWLVVNNLAPNHPIFATSKTKITPKEQVQGLGDQFRSLVADVQIALERMFKRG